MIIIFGGRGIIKDIDEFLSMMHRFSKDQDLVMQAFDAQMIFGKDHLISAVSHAQRAFKQSTNATNSLSLEILLYAAGERQIQKAIKKMGVKQGKQTVAFVLIDERNKTKNSKWYSTKINTLLRLILFTRDDTILEGNHSKLKRFGISAREIHSLPASKLGDIILERVAMVDVIKKR